MNNPLPLKNIRLALIVAPHPDDETIGAFGLMRHLVRHGTDVRITVVTNGAASHKSKAWPPARLIARRRHETRHALARIGIPQTAITFLGFPDSGLQDMPPTGFSRLKQKLAQGQEPDLVVRPSVFDFHADHRIVARACQETWPPRVHQLTYLVWPDASQPTNPPRYKLPLKDSRLMKAAAIATYRSQTGLIEDDPDGFCMDRPFIQSLAGPNEYFGMR